MFYEFNAYLAAQKLAEIERDADLARLMNVEFDPLKGRRKRSRSYRQIPFLMNGCHPKSLRDPLYLLYGGRCAGEEEL